VSAPIHPHGILARMAEKESEFEKLARLIKEEGDDIRSDVRDQISGVHVEIGGLRKEMHDGFAKQVEGFDDLRELTTYLKFKSANCAKAFDI
jgi:hypothetical protein